MKIRFPSINKDLRNALIYSFVLFSFIPAFWVSAAYATQLNLIAVPPKQEATGMNVTPTTLFGKLHNAMSNSTSNLLWSVYPAGVRGQVILQATPGSDPLTSGGW